MTPAPHQIDDRFLDREGMASRLCRTAETITDWVKRGKLRQPYNLQGTLLWYWPEVVADIKAGHVNSELDTVDPIREALGNVGNAKAG